MVNRVLVALCLIITAIALTLSLILISDATENPTTDATENQTTGNSYDGHLAIEELTQYLTAKESEQRKIVSFLSSMENVFKIDPHILFQESDYLIVTYTDSERYGLKIYFYFTGNKPITETRKERDGENINWVYFNGYVSYSYTYRYGSSWFKSWHQHTSKDKDWSGGFGWYKDDPELGWYKIVNLKEFNWYKP